MNLEKLIYKRADIENIEKMLTIIHRCLREINDVDFSTNELNEALKYFNPMWLKEIIETRHYYEVWDNNQIIASKSLHEFYRKLGYEYREYPPIFHAGADTTIMYKLRKID